MITPDQRLALIGLLYLARDYAKKMGECEKAMTDMIGKKEDYSHFNDAVFDERTVDELLKVEGILVTEKTLPVC